MLPFFATPWALAALAALPALAAIYWLRGRSRRVPVSSLLLWADQQQARPGGLRVERLQTPLLFFLEILALALLSVAAADPQAATGQEARPLVVVLDDSYSMQAGGDDAPRSRATAALREELDRGGHYAVRFVLAGSRPQALGEPVRTAAEALALLDGWRCRSPDARLEEAVGVATELGGPRAFLLVLSDHAPAAAPDRGRVRWWAFGTARPNVAFVSAARAGRAGQERCLLEVANLADEPQTSALTVEAGGVGVLHHGTLKLAPRQTRRLLLKLPAAAGAVTARLDDDALDIDNRVTLVREARPPVRAEVRVRDEALRPLLEKALRATGRAELGPGRPDLLFTDQEGAGVEDPDTWPVRLMVAKDAEAFVGPFVLDRSHPLTDGLSLRGVVWGAGRSGSLPGRPVVLAGNVPLLCDAETAAGGHALGLRFRPDLSTLQDTPEWPVLVWNLVAWRAAEAPGLARANLRLGDAAVLKVPAGLEAAVVTAPDGSRQTVPAHGRQVILRPEEVGRYEVLSAASKHAFAVNALSARESDLTGCVTGRWGEWAEDAGGWLEARGLSWLLLLLVVGLLTAHLALLARGSRPAAEHAPPSTEGLP
jgi:hypothetical protein